MLVHPRETIDYASNSQPQPTPAHPTLGALELQVKGSAAVAEGMAQEHEVTQKTKRHQ